MPSRFHIRLAIAKDLDALVGLEQAAFRADRFTEDQIDYLLTRSRATNLVIEDRDMIAGSACVLWRKSHQGGRLYNIAIDPDYQGLGLGKKLLNECELEAARRNCRVMTLEVREDNDRARAMYETLGYRVIGSVKNYYEDGSPAIKMSKDLKRKIVRKRRLKIAYYSQSLDFTCGPASLMMALHYFRNDLNLNRSLELLLWKEATLIFMSSGYGGTDGYGLALSALKRGLECHMIQSMDTTPMLRSVRSDQKREVMRTVHADLKQKSLEAGLGIGIYEYGIDEIISGLYRGMIPVAMISTYRLTGDRMPHWVVVTGFDEENVYIHDPDLESYESNRAHARNLKVKQSEFLKMTRYGKEVYRCLLLIGPVRNR
jgi:ribosomal-protein-alanine acetyltransferase